MEFQNQIHLLALANTPESCTSILDWVPFPGGDTLGQVINRHNERCVQGYQQLGLLRDWIETLAEVVKIVPHDLSTIEDLRKKDFAKIRILVIDLDAIEKARTVMRKITLLMAGYDHFYHLAQISQEHSAVPCTEDFAGLPVIPSRPPVLMDLSVFKSFLARLCEAHRTVLSSYPLLPLPSSRPDEITEQDLVEASLSVASSRRANPQYIEALPSVASDIRDAAILRDLSLEETATLTRQAAIQELALARIAAQVRTPTKRQVIVDAIREPVSKIVFALPTQTPRIQEVGLVKLSLARPKHDLTAEQRKTLAGLGVRGKTFAAVHFDQPSTWDQIDRVKGLVEATRFSADLPDF